MADYSKAQDPTRMAQLELSAAHRATTDEEQAMHLRIAQVHATLAVADAMRAQTDWLACNDLHTRVIGGGAA